MEAGGTVRQCVRQERTQHRGAGRQISSAWCLGEVEERNKVRFLFAMEILPGNPAFVKFEGHAPSSRIRFRSDRATVALRKREESLLGLPIFQLELRNHKRTCEMAFWLIDSNDYARLRKLGPVNRKLRQPRRVAEGKVCAESH